MLKTFAAGPEPAHVCHRNQQMHSGLDLAINLNDEQLGQLLESNLSMRGNAH
jgi:hypothetical protein